MTALCLPTNTYTDILKDAAKVSWTVRDVMAAKSSLDFTKPFLPEQLAHTQDLTCLTSTEQLTLNQIRGNSYLHLFGLLEESILPLVVNHVKAIGCSDIEATQAYLGFAEQESKHIHLFREFGKAFEKGFGSECDCIGPPSVVAEFIHQHSPLGVALITLHIEWMTQRHFQESVRDNHRENLDPLFCSLLRHHWQEEAQHARLDALMVESMAQELDASAIARGIDDYLTIIQYLNSGFLTQVQKDIDSLIRATGRSLSSIDRQVIQETQLSSYQQVFLLSGMTHPNFADSIRSLSPAGYDRIADATQSFSRS